MVGHEFQQNHSECYVGNTVNRSKNGSKSARSEAPAIIWSIDNGSDNQGGSRKVECNTNSEGRVDKIY